MTRSCPAGAELSRALSEGAGEAVREHLAACPACRGEWDALKRTIADARRMPVDLPDDSRREQVRTSLIAAARARKKDAGRWGGRWRLPAGVLLGAAAAAAIFFATRGGGRGQPAAAERPPFLGTVHPQSSARYELASRQPDEVVRLKEGTIDVDVEPLAPGERFRVVVGDGEVEVRGTSFQVTATGDRLVAVHVARGRVEVRAGGAAAVVLGAGDSWRPPVDAAAWSTAAAEAVSTGVTSTAAVPAPRQPAATAAPIESIEAKAPVAPATRSPAEAAYDEGWDAMRGGEFPSAAAAFERSWTLAPDGALAEDARYWRAVALARIPRPEASIAAFIAFLDGYPQSPHAGSASAMLGWLLLAAHDVDGAEARFRAAAGDANDSVRASAQSGLDAVERSARDR